MRVARIRFTTAGESHGPGLTAVVEGLPAGLELSPEDLNTDMARRQLGHGRGGRMKIEKDSAEVTPGVRHGRTLGSPVAMWVVNRDYQNWVERMNPWPVDAEVPEVHLPRPGHADLAGMQKYGHSDVRNVLERASARETAARVPCGALARTFLRELGVEIRSHVLQIGAVDAPRARRPDGGGLRGRRRVAGALHRRRRDRRDGRGDRSRAEGERVARRRLRGARVRTGAGPRLAHLVGRAARRATRAGDPLDPRDEGRRGGRRVTRWPASPAPQAHDEIFWSAERGYYRETNRAGGVEGGMTNGEPLVVTGAMKPLPTLTKPLRSVDTDTKEPAQR